MDDGTRAGALGLEAILFDTFGTLVDWRGSLIEDLRGFGAQRGLVVDWPAFVDAWRGAYRPSMDRVRHGTLPWTPLDALHRASFDQLASVHGIAGKLDEADRRWCVDRWHRLRPWGDVVAGLRRLRTRFILGTLSNGNVRLLVDLAKTAALPLDLILSAENFRHYKPDPRTYRGAVELLATKPQHVMLAAAHTDDLRAARAEGLRTAFIARPHEYGPQPAHVPAADGEADLEVDDLLALAERLGA